MWGHPNLRSVTAASAPVQPSCAFLLTRLQTPGTMWHLTALHTAPTGPVPHIPAAPPPGCSLAPVTTRVPMPEKKIHTYFPRTKSESLAEPNRPAFGDSGQCWICVGPP